MKYLDVYQCETNSYIRLELVGQVRYQGSSFGVDGLTDGKEYFIVRDKNGILKVVDDSDEDYIYDLRDPKPAYERDARGKFILIEDLTGELKAIT